MYFLSPLGTERLLFHNSQLREYSVFIVVCSTKNYLPICLVTSFSKVKLCSLYLRRPTPVAARTKTWVCCHSLTGMVGANPTGDMDVRVLLGRGLCEWMITRRTECDRKASIMRRFWSNGEGGGGLLRMEKIITCNSSYLSL